MRPIPLGFLVDWLCAMAACTAVFFATTGTVRGVRAIVRHYRIDPTRCAGCRYSLKGLIGNICPECGRPFADNPAASPPGPDNSTPTRR